MNTRNQERPRKKKNFLNRASLAFRTTIQEEGIKKIRSIARLAATGAGNLLLRGGQAVVKGGYRVGKGILNNVRSQLGQRRR